MTKVTIGITAFREGALLTRAWQSVLDQTIHDWKAVMVLDGGADEETARIFEGISHPALKKYRFEKNQGPYLARTKGIELTETEWFYFLDGDDTLPEEAVENLIVTITEDSEFYCGDCLLVQPNGLKRIISKPYSGLKELLLSSNYPSIVAWRKPFFLNIGGYDNQLIRGRADFEFAIRLFREGYQYAYLPANVYNYHLRLDSVHKSYNGNLGQRQIIIYLKYKSLFSSDRERRIFLEKYIKASIDHNIYVRNKFLGRLYIKRLFYYLNDNYSLIKNIYYRLPFALIMVLNPWINRLRSIVIKIR